jgi:DNA-binding IclR family transcriptional regulator
MLFPLSRCDLLTNHARVLLCIACDRHVRIREIAQCAQLTERATHRLVTDLCEAGYLEKRRVGARNEYEIKLEMPLGHPLEAELPIGELLAPLINHLRAAQSGTPDATPPPRFYGPRISIATRQSSGVGGGP